MDFKNENQEGNIAFLLLTWEKFNIKSIAETNVITKDVFFRRPQKSNHFFKLIFEFLSIVTFLFRNFPKLNTILLQLHEPKILAF